MSKLEYKFGLVQYDGDNVDEVLSFCKGKALIKEKDIYIKTNQTELICNKTDFVLNHSDGEFYPISELVFRMIMQKELRMFLKAV